MDLITIYIHSQKMQHKIKTAAEDADKKTWQTYNLILSAHPPLNPHRGGIWIKPENGEVSYFDGISFCPVMLKMDTGMKEKDIVMKTLETMKIVNLKERTYRKNYVKEYDLNFEQLTYVGSRTQGLIRGEVVQSGD